MEFKPGDKVNVIDGSWSYSFGDKGTKREHGITLKGEFEVVQTGLNMPIYERLSNPEAESGVPNNDTLIKEVATGKIVSIQQEFLRKMEPAPRYQIGDRVVPVSKSVNAPLKASCWEEGKQQGFLFVVKRQTTLHGENGVFYACWHENGKSGDWFLESDLTPYVEKKQPAFAVGDKVYPVSKSIGEFAGNIDSEPNWIDSKKRGYFYVTQSFQHGGKQAYGCHSEDIRTGGNHFLESDLTPYVEPPKFKQGDCVIIKEGLSGFYETGDVCYIDRLDEKGAYLRDKNNKPVGYGYFDMFEHYVEPKPAAFKLGDRVRVLKPYDGRRSLVGKIGIVCHVNASSIGVDFGEDIQGHSCQGHCTQGYGWRYPKSGYLELVSATPSNLCPAPKTVTLETITVTFSGNKTTCIIENDLGRFKGCAKCSPDDVWDEQTGIELAKVRAYRKMLETEERNIRMI